MKYLIKLLYKILPDNLIFYLGNSDYLKAFRNKIVRQKNIELIIKEKIEWGKGKFNFYAPIKMAIKAKKRGIENKLIRNSLKLINEFKIENPVILDIGANYGFISLALQSNLEKTAKIYSFEPHPVIAEIVKKSVRLNKFENIEIFNVAVGNEDCDIELNLYGQTSNILNLDNGKSTKTIIKQIKLDNYLIDNNIIPNFIKIDVDGYELNVLKGLKKTLLNFKPIMVVETNDEIAVIDFLKDECFYKLLDLDLNEFKTIPNNVFCIPK